jgi:uncharacterized protein
MHTTQLENNSHPLPVIILAEYCDSFLSRLRGLMFRKTITPQQGLILVQDRQSRVDAAIHMFFVNFDLAVIWLDDNKKVVDRCLAKRWRPFYMPSSPARYVLETHPDSISFFSIGDHIKFQ